MLELTFDRDARSIYVYFTDITEGDDADERELPGVWLLDAADQIVGLRLELAGSGPRLWELAGAHEHVQLDGDTLTITFATTPVAAEEELPYGAIVDIDGQGRALGLETPATIEFAIAERLAAIQPLLIEWDADDDDEAADDEDDDEAAVPPVDPDQADSWDVDQAVLEQAKLAEPPTLIDPNATVRAGFVALVGKPNVGKSTLLNTLLGQKVSIVSPKPQTTRVPVRGILNGPAAQIVFVDTPGIHEPRHKLGNFMVEVARRAIPDADVLVFMVDVTTPPTRLDREIAQLVTAAHKPTLLVLNKVDATRAADVHLPQYRELGAWDDEVAISARDGLGMETLIESLVAHLPEGPRLYPEDQLSDMSERELVGELIREKVMLNTAHEIPHSVAVEVEEWEQRGETLYIRANISVERASQKGIVIGAGGAMLRKIGAAARYEIERALQQHVFLDLWIKVRENWRQKPSELRWLGYDVKFFRG